MAKRPTPLRHGLPAVLATSFFALFVSCTGDSDRERLIRVPADAATISEAVERARPGTTIEIAPGTYNEALDITVDRITIRGEDRNTVILDGLHELSNGVSVAANDVAVENLTVRNYLQNGVVFNGVSAATDDGRAGDSVVFGKGDAVLDGYRVSYVTAYNNGLYGIYAFASRNGLIEHSWASGHPDSGLYVGQCQPCDVLIVDSVAERNAIGYFGTNASGGVVVARSEFRRNRLGIAPNSQDMERLAPQAEAVFVGNVVADNDDPGAPAIPEGYFGSGIAVGGGTKNRILRNLIIGHQRAGIELLTLDGYIPRGNRFEGNVLADNSTDVLFAVEGLGDSGDNCFAGNTLNVSIPEDIETLMPCGADARTFPIPTSPQTTPPPKVDYRKLPAPPAQQSMPDSARRASAGAGAIPEIDIETITVPQR